MGLAKACDTAIVGGGASGSAVLLALAQRQDTLSRTMLFDPNPPGPGTAYRDRQPDSLLMNGAARAMSIVPGDDEHLVRRLGGERNALIPRKRYGEYVAQTLALAFAENPNIDYCAAEIVDIAARGNSYVLTDRAGTEHVARNVVLGLGNFEPNDAFLPAAARSFAGYHGNPWHLDTRNVRGDVVVLGSRLTALDVAAQLEECGFGGSITMISRHGLVPALEDPDVRGLDPESMNLDARSPLALLRSLRSAAREHCANGGDWRAVIDSIREITPAIWAGWDTRERRRFLRHAQSYWAAHRFRVPAQTYQAFKRLEASGQLRVLAGRLTGAGLLGENTLRMTISRPSDELDIHAGTVVNATGPNLDYCNVSHPLVRSALRRGLIRPDALKLGIDVTSELQCISAAGVPAPNLYTLGPAVRGHFYEATALPEIRDHASRVAASIHSRVALAALGAVS